MFAMLLVAGLALGLFLALAHPLGLLLAFVLSVVVAGTQVDLAPIVNQVVVPLITPVLVAGLLWIGYRVQALFHVNILAGHREVFETAVKNGINLAAGKLAAVPMTVDVKNATVATVAAYVVKTAPDAVAKLGLAKDADALAAAIEARLPPQ